MRNGDTPMKVYDAIDYWTDDGQPRWELEVLNNGQNDMPFVEPMGSTAIHL